MIPQALPLAQYQAHKRAIDAAVRRVIDSGSYILGQEVAAFEETFAEYCQRRHGIGVASGTDGLILALKALEIGPSAEVITVSHTAVATVAAVLATGALPVLVDVDPVFYTLDPAALEAARTARTRAIVAVHLYGQAADMDGIKAFADRHGLALVEDCAQATGAFYGDRPVGSIGDVACFSFFPTKNLGAIGDAGMVVTSDARIAESVRRLRQYGWNGQRQTTDIGVNSRLDEIQAAILTAKLPSLNGDNARRAALAAHYTAGLVGLPVTVPATRPDCHHAFHLYVIDCDNRDGLRSRLASVGIGSGVHYPLPVHRQNGYAEKVRLPAGGLPVTERLARRVLSLPLFPELTDAGIDRVVAEIHAHYRDQHEPPTAAD